MFTLAVKSYQIVNHNNNKKKKHNNRNNNNTNTNNTNDTIDIASHVSKWLCDPGAVGSGGHPHLQRRSPARRHGDEGDMYICTYIHIVTCIRIYIYIYIHIYVVYTHATNQVCYMSCCAHYLFECCLLFSTGLPTPGLHNKIPAYKIFARGWVAQICLFDWWRLRFSRGWVRKDGNLVTETGCTMVRSYQTARR